MLHVSIEGGGGRVVFEMGAGGVRPKGSFKKNRWIGGTHPIPPPPAMGNPDIYTHCFVFLVWEWSYGVFIHFTLVHINLGFMPYHFVHMVVFNQFPSIITGRLLLGLTMLVTLICENDPKEVSLLKVKF